MMLLSRLLLLQVVYAAMALGYLFLSVYRLQVTGEALSAAPLLPSILLLLVYGGCLFLPSFSRVKSYRLAMCIALLLFGGGGVIGLNSPKSSKRQTARSELSNVCSGLIPQSGREFSGRPAVNPGEAGPVTVG